MAVGRRTFLGTNSSFGSRERSYLIADGIEIDEFDGYDVIRKRVFFDDVLFVTYHRRFGLAFLLLTGISALLCFSVALPALLAGSTEWTVMAVVMFVVGAPFGIAFLLRLILRQDVVTVFGRRTRATLRFSFLKARARRTFEEICDRVRHAQKPPAPAMGTEWPEVV